MEYSSRSLAWRHVEGGACRWLCSPLPSCSCWAPAAGFARRFHPAAAGRLPRGADEQSKQTETRHFPECTHTVVRSRATAWQAAGAAGALRPP